jgi:acetyl-CoA carboxylase/biotin carboxylase 1
MTIFNHGVPNVTGGNSIDKATPSAVKDFVKENGGHTVITKVR